MRVSENVRRSVGVGDPKYQHTMNNDRVLYDVVKRSDWAKPTPDVCGTKSAFCDKTFPGRKQQPLPSSGCKIGDFYRLSRHSYSDLDRCDNGEELVKSTTATNLRVHFASENNGPPPNDKKFHQSGWHTKWRRRVRYELWV